jgi:zinc transport system ATP-binding protein
MAADTSLSRPDLFECQRLRVGIAGRALLPPLDLTIRAGEFWAVVGRNGAGKTTWLRTLLGLLPPVEGRVRSAADVRVSYLPQRSGMDDLYPLTAREVVSIGAERGWSFLGGVSARARRDKIERALAEVGAAELADRPFRRLSEGQKQRVLFARLAAADAELAILDEPTSAMDKVAEKEAFELIRTLRDKYGLAVLVVSHYLSIVRHFADRAILLDADSQQVVSGAPNEVFAHPAFRARYGDFIEEAPGA